MLCSQAVCHFCIIDKASSATYKPLGAVYFAGCPQRVQNAPDRLVTARAQSKMRWFPDNLWNRSWFFWSVFHLLLCVHLLLILTPGMMGNPLTSRSHSSTDEFVSEMYKCPDVCKCELILKRSSQGASIGTSSNYKVRSNCYRQRVRHLSWTHSLSNLTVQL